AARPLPRHPGCAGSNTPSGKPRVRTAESSHERGPSPLPEPSRSEVVRSILSRSLLLPSTVSNQPAPNNTDSPRSDRLQAARLAGTETFRLCEGGIRSLINLGAPCQSRPSSPCCVELRFSPLIGCDQARWSDQQPEGPPALLEDRYVCRACSTTCGC